MCEEGDGDSDPSEYRDSYLETDMDCVSPKRGPPTLPKPAALLTLEVGGPPPAFSPPPSSCSSPVLHKTDLQGGSDPKRIRNCTQV